VSPVSGRVGARALTVSARKGNDMDKNTGNQDAAAEAEKAARDAVDDGTFSAANLARLTQNA
jgi:hypothetical protein